MEEQSFTSRYAAKQPDANGFFHYTPEEHAVWVELISRQQEIVTNRACEEYLAGLDMLKLSEHEIPQTRDISNQLKQMTGWTVEPVAALISYQEFFDLLAKKKFPAASFSRHQDEIDYLQEPDIFHEFFGHCPLLANKPYANFMHQYGKLAARANLQQQNYLARLYWFTVEFGLVKSPQGLRCYGGGILSSMDETQYAIESNVPERKAFEILSALRTPYRIDIKQPIYFVLNELEELYEILTHDLIGLVDIAIELGDYEPVFKNVEKRWIRC